MNKFPSAMHRISSFMAFFTVFYVAALYEYCMISYRCLIFCLVRDDPFAECISKRCEFFPGTLTALNLL